MSDGTTRDAARAEVEELLRAGAVLPPGTTGGGERAVPVFTRAFRHPGLDGRIVVRLTPADPTAATPSGAEPAGDTGGGFLGLLPAGEPVEVGVGQHRAMGFPEWVLVRHPSDGHLAMSLVDEMNKVARTVRSRAKKARATYESMGERLAGSVPHFLPTFYEEAGRVFLAAGQQAYASQMFVNARKVETAHALPFDEARMDAVFLEFALADAMPTKVLSSYAKGLSSRVPAATAFRHLRGLFVRLAAHGVAPSSPGASDLRRLAKAVAGKHALAEEMAYLRDVLPLPGTLKAPPGWWKAHRAALLELTRREPAVRGTLLGLLPSGWEQEELGQWLDLLEKSGATEGLCDAALPAEVRPPDGTAGWTRRFLALCRTDDWRLAPPGLYPLLDRMADTLRAELRAEGATLPPPVSDVDLLDQLLALRIPVADPAERPWLNLQGWAARDERRDLVALEADPRFRRVFLDGCPTYEREGIDRRTVTRLAESPGGRPMLAEWVAREARRYLTSGLGEYTGFRNVFESLRWLPGEVLATAEHEVREALGTGMAPGLARGLRSGIIDELGWPAWDEAIGSPASSEDARGTLVGEAWPHLIVFRGGRARVVGPEGTVLDHEMRLPPRSERWGADARFVDGGLLVFWKGHSYQDGSHGYWYDADNGASSPMELDGDVHSPYACHADGSGGNNGMPPTSLPLPGGGRATGGGVLRRGDTHIPYRRPVIGDGTSYWVWVRDWSDEGNSAWFTYDPAGATERERGVPDWFGEGLSAAPEGSTLGTAWLLPVPSAGSGPLCAPVDGVLGWRVITLPDGTRRGEDLAGRSVVVPYEAIGNPEHALVFPGTDRPVAVLRSSSDIRLLDAEGALLAEVGRGQTAGAFSAGTPLLPPLRYWPLLQPRDLQGSAALREVGDDTAAALLAAAAAEAPGDADDRDPVLASVRTLLPQVGHEALLKGITGVTRHAAEQQLVLDAALARLDSAVQGKAPEEPRPALGDRLLASALNGVGLTERDERAYYDFQHYLFELPRLVARSMKGLAQPAPAGIVHLSLDKRGPLEYLNALALPELPAVLALRAASQATVEEHRQALDAFLDEVDAQGLTELDPGHWRRVHLAFDPDTFDGPGGTPGYGRGTVLDLDGGAFLVFPDDWYQFVREYGHYEIKGRHYGALHYDPSGRFETPAPYTLVSEEPFVPQADPTRAPGWVAAFRAELAERGPAPWRPEAAEEFARLTGITPTTARLVLAGLPQIDDKRVSVPSATLKVVGVKSADARVAKDELRSLDTGALRAVVAALLPAEPSRLWTHGPDTARAAAVWNERLGRRTPLPEEVLHDAVRTVEAVGWAPADALRGFVDLATEPRLTEDRTWSFGRYYLETAEKTPGFDGSVLKGSVALAAWLAHRLPSGDPLRAALPGVLTALRERLAHPGLLLALERRGIDWEAFRRAAGDPAETGDGYERHGAVVLGAERTDPVPAIRPALLDAAGHAPHLAALFTGERPNAQETALRLVHDRPFAELLADPGNPLAGERDADGLWWPQDPARSVPDLVGEAAKRYGIGEDAAVLYLMLLAMPDPTDRNTARWTGWGGQRGGTARLRAARAELAATDLVVEGSRSKAGRSLFLPGGWTQPPNPHLPLERWKLPMYDLLEGEAPVMGVIVPTRPVTGLYRAAWQRVQDGDGPRLEVLEVPRARKRRR
ncbi:DNA-binding protein [Streptomyces sp. NBC_00334]|uniref:DNA-binding protein n=1 Tax=Streptomyces sp. NBC_00334 TaxID=2975713 RepID=UPI002E2D6DA1|nr:DNA-binding protein [Streptomyces sp. NBC_00334]